MRLPPLASVAELLRLYRVTARQQLSQNFLLDSNVTGSGGNVVSELLVRFL